MPEEIYTELLKEEIEDALNGLLGDIYKKLRITQRDITPDQSGEWEIHVEGLAELFMELIEQNKEA